MRPYKDLEARFSPFVHLEAQGKLQGFSTAIFGVRKLRRPGDLRRKVQAGAERTEPSAWKAPRVYVGRASLSKERLTVQSCPASCRSTLRSASAGRPGGAATWRAPGRDSGSG